MATGGDSRRLQFQCPAELVERLDAVAEAFDRDRRDLLVAAVRGYLHRVTESETFRVLVAERYYDGRLTFEEAKRLVGTETARRFRLLGGDLEGDALDTPSADGSDDADGCDGASSDGQRATDSEDREQ